MDQMEREGGEDPTLSPPNEGESPVLVQSSSSHIAGGDPAME